MAVFGKYAQYYNLLYKDKDYQSEVDYIDTLIKTYTNPDVYKILDIGCGTGNHDILLAKKGYSVTGVDMSEKMVAEANKKAENYPGLNFHLGNATSFNLDEKFDVVTSLFHVMSYQTSNEALFKSMQNAFNHLHENGVFIFDFWYGPAVLTDRPVLRVKTLEDDEIKVYRIAKPVVHANKNIVDVNYEVLILDKKTNSLEQICETHNMRYLFKPELDLILGKIGFKTIKFLGWMSLDKEPDFTSWNACLIVKR